MAFLTTGGLRNFPVEGCPGIIVNKDGNAGINFLPECPGYHYNFGGGNPPPPTVTPLEHAGYLESYEKEAPCHCPLRQGGIKEAKTAGGGGAAGEFREGLPGLRGTIEDRDIV